MKRNIKKIACIALAGMCLAQAAGCAKSGSAKEIEELTVEYCNALVCLDVDAVIDLSKEDLEDKRADLERELTIRKGDVYTEESAQFVSAIADTLDYEIAKDSISVDEEKGVAEATVIFEYCDYEELMDEDLDDIEELTGAVDDAPTLKKSVVIEFNDTDDGWKVVDGEEVLDKVMEFTSARYFAIGSSISEYSVYAVERDNYYNLTIIGDYREIEYDPSYRVLIDYEDYDIEIHGENAHFIDGYDRDTNTGSVAADDAYFELSLSYNCEISDPDFTGFYATVEHNGEIVESVGDTVDIRVSPERVGEGNWNGDLTVRFYEPGGCLIWQGTITVV